MAPQRRQVHPFHSWGYDLDAPQAAHTMTHWPELALRYASIW